MKFFPATKKTDEEKDKKKKLLPAGDGADAKVISSEEQKSAKAEMSSADSDSKKSRFAWKPKVTVQKETEKSPPISNQTEQRYAVTEDDAHISDKAGRLVEIISATKDTTINPSINLEENRVSYPLLAEIGEDVYNVDVLDKLASSSVDVLEKGVYERLTVCPQHPESFATSIRLYCTSCSSLDIVKLNLLEHKNCGYIAEKTDFGATSVDDIKKCPSCKNTIRDLKKEIRILGNWYQCNSCKTKFDDAIIKLHCRKFDHDFDINQATIIVIPNYKIKMDSKKLHNYTFSLIPQLKNLLVSHGFVMEESASVKGKSGVSHTTDIYASNNENKTIIIDIKGAENVIDDAEVYSMFGKIFDISPTIAIFIGIPSVSDKAKAMAVAHDISIVTDKNFNEVIPAVEQILKSRLYASSEEIKKL